MKKARFLIPIISILNLILSFASTETSSAQGSKVWGTYCGGTGDEISYGCATDAVGNVYICGYTNSPNNIATPGAFQTTGNSLSATNFDLFLVKYNAAGSRIWGTYYGGPGNEESACAVTVDPSGNVYLTGNTTSSTGIASGGFQNTYAGNTDAFLVKFDSGGHRLWATYYGGNADDEGMQVATDAAGNVYMEGITSSSSGIAFNGFQNAYGGAGDAFLVKFDQNGNRLWATYYGGSKSEVGAERTGLAVDSRGNVYLSGTTLSDAGIAYNGFRNVFTVGYWNLLGQKVAVPDDFLVKFNANGNRLWATYYGGTGKEYSSSVATDASGNVYLAGETDSPDSIAYQGFKDTSNVAASIDNTDDFLVKFDSSGNRLWATYYGGDDFEDIGVVKTDNSGRVHLFGGTYSTTGVAYGGFQNNLVDTVLTMYIRNEFTATFDGNGNRQCATYFGQGDDKEGNMAVDGAGNVYLAGNTHSGDPSIAAGGFQKTFGGGNWDAYLVMLSPCASCTYPIASITPNGPTTFCPGENVTLNAQAGSGYSYHWSTGATTTSINVIATGNYSVTVSNSCSSIISNSISVDVSKSFQAGTVSALRNPICSGTPASLSISGASGSPIQWQSAPSVGNFSDISGATSYSYIEAPTQTTRYRVIVGTGNCADTSDEFTLTVKPAPTAIFSNTVNGKQVTFNSTGTSNDVITYHWDFGDDSSSAVPSPVHTFATNDTFYVCLTVYNGSNCSYTFCKYVSVEATGVANISADGNFIIYPNPFSNSIFIKNITGGEFIGRIEIYNMLGQMLMDKENISTHAGTIQLDVSNLTNGVYELRIKSENTNYIQKLIKLK